MSDDLLTCECCGREFDEKDLAMYDERVMELMHFEYVFCALCIAKGIKAFASEIEDFLRAGGVTSSKEEQSDV